MNTVNIFIVISTSIITYCYATNIITTSVCLGCICEATTKCNRTFECGERDKNYCGMFGMTKPYWADGYKPIVPGSNDKGDLYKAFKRCATDAACASSAVQNYLHRYQKDCNNDGKIDCSDLVRIHMYGQTGCTTRKLQGAEKYRFETCTRYITGRYGSQAL